MIGANIPLSGKFDQVSIGEIEYSKTVPLPNLCSVRNGFPLLIEIIECPSLPVCRLANVLISGESIRCAFSFLSLVNIPSKTGWSKSNSLNVKLAVPIF